MKSKSRILLWFSICIATAVFLEIALQFNWRSSFDFNSVDNLASTLNALSTETLRAETKIVYFGDQPRLPQEIRAELSHGSVQNGDEEDSRAIRESCCLGNNDVCVAKLREFARVNRSKLRFHIVHDSSCTTIETRIVDHLAFTSGLLESVIDHWTNAQPTSFSGPIGDTRGLSVARILLVESLGAGNASRVHWNPSHVFMRAVGPLIEELAPISEIILDTQTVYAANATQVLDTLSGSVDEYEMSRLINDEIERWTGPSHLLEFPAFAMPPLENIAFVVQDTDRGLFQLSEWGSLSFHSSSDVLDCQDSSCELKEDGVQKISDLVTSLIRSWLGLSSAKCSGCIEHESRVISTTELILIAEAMRIQYMRSAIRDLKKQENVLKSLPRLAFKGKVVELMNEAVDLLDQSLKEWNFLSTSVVKSKLACTLAGEALHHESIMAKPSFSLEYLFALYAPIGLPVLFPVLSALIAMYKARRTGKSVKVDKL